jgi:hypothetical protein
MDFLKGNTEFFPGIGKIKFEGKESGSYQPNIRQNFIVKPRDKEILEDTWRQNVLKVKAMFVNFIDTDRLDPFGLLKKETDLLI